MAGSIHHQRGKGGGGFRGCVTDRVARITQHCLLKCEDGQTSKTLISGLKLYVSDVLGGILGGGGG